MSFSLDSEAQQALQNSRPTDLRISKQSVTSVLRDELLGLPLSPNVELHAPICEDPAGLLPMPECDEDSDDGSQSSSDSEENGPSVGPPVPSPAPQVAVVRTGSPVETTATNETDSTVPAEDRPSHVSLLGGKYLLFSNPGIPNPLQPPATLPPTAKNLMKCINVESREHFFCKVVPRSATGLSLLAAYHRLDDTSDCINKIHEIILAPKLIYLIFPLNYGNVHSYLLAKKRLREGEAIHLFKQMVNAVEYCHEKGIVLRDLKLGKFVFLDRDRTHIKLESLEDAVLLSDTSDDGLSDKHGCPNYVSPEKAEILRSNNKYPGKATDIWGLGVMLYTMLVGRYPFNDADHAKLFSKIRRGSFSIPEPVTPNAKCLIRCLLRKDPTSRLSCNQILRHPWILEERRAGNTICSGRDSQPRGHSGYRSSQRGPVTVNQISSSLPVYVTSTSRLPSQSLSSRGRTDNGSPMEEDQVVPVYNPMSTRS